MNRFIAATTAALMISAPAFALSQSDALMIESYVPGVELSELTEEQVLQLNTIAFSGDSEGDKRTKMRAIIGDASIAEESMPMADGQVVEVEPGVGTSPADVNIIATNAFTGTEVVTTAAPISEAELLKLEKYAPGFDVSTVSEADLQVALSIAFGGDSEGEKARKISTLLNG